MWKIYLEVFGHTYCYTRERLGFPLLQIRTQRNQIFLKKNISSDRLLGYIPTSVLRQVDDESVSLATEFHEVTVVVVKLDRLAIIGTLL